MQKNLFYVSKTLNFYRNRREYDLGKGPSLPMKILKIGRETFLALKLIILSFAISSRNREDFIIHFGPFLLYGMQYFLMKN